MMQRPTAREMHRCRPTTSSAAEPYQWQIRDFGVRVYRQGGMGERTRGVPGACLRLSTRLAARRGAGRVSKNKCEDPDEKFGSTEAIWELSRGFPRRGDD
jgi:hypothetical protein